MSVTIVAIKDGTKIELDRKCVRLSGLLKNLEEEYKEDNEMPIPEIDGDVLKKIVVYLEHYKDEDPKDVPKPLVKYDIKETYCEWDEEYISEFSSDKAFMFRLMEAANYLDCRFLLELACSKVAVMIKDYSGKQMCEYFGLEEDLTEEQAKKFIEDFEKQREDERQKKADEYMKKMEEKDGNNDSDEDDDDDDEDDEIDKD
jgi:S-phase kinase-associated protein 1